MVGSIVLATDQGLGYLARDFFNHGLIHKVYIHPHSTRVNHRDWYPGSAIVSTPEELLETCDSLFFIETAFDWSIIKKAKEKGIKTVLMPMYECTPNPLPVEPDLVLSPSLLDLDYYPHSTLVTVPVGVQKCRQRQTAKVFVHNAGNGGLGGRNGTAEIIEAWKHVKSPATLLLRSQVPIPLGTRDSRIVAHVGTLPEKELYAYGDVFLFPEKFNGLSLPLQEAYASGMLVMAGDRYPMNTWLPREPLIPVESFRKEKVAVEFSYAQYSPQAIAEQVDKWFNKDISELSRQGIEWGKENSWEKLIPLYQVHFK